MQIITVPNKILKNKTREVKKIDSKIKSLIKMMREVLKESRGVGLSAPQIGRRERISIIGFTPTEEELKKNPNLPVVPKMVLTNPQITWKSKEIKVESEGCLSIPDIRVEVPRHKKIHLKYINEAGQKKKLKTRGLLARIIQHETDHLNGKIITDYK